MHNLHTEDNSCTTSQHELEIRISQQPSLNSVFSSATQVKPHRAAIETGWVTHREYRREYIVLTSSRVPRVLRFAFHVSPFPFPFKRLPRGLVLSFLLVLFLRIVWCYF